MHLPGLRVRGFAFLTTRWSATRWDTSAAMTQKESVLVWSNNATAPEAWEAKLTVLRCLRECRWTIFRIPNGQEEAPRQECAARQLWMIRKPAGGGWCLCESRATDALGGRPHVFLVQHVVEVQVLFLITKLAVVHNLTKRRSLFLKLEVLGKMTVSSAVGYHIAQNKDYSRIQYLPLWSAKDEHRCTSHVSVEFEVLISDAETKWRTHLRVGR